MVDREVVDSELVDREVVDREVAVSHGVMVIGGSWHRG